jgi:diguanylate cyclase (GGDEF)-like protein
MFVEPLIQAASARLAQADAAEIAAAQVTLLSDIAVASKEVLLADDPGQRLVESVSRIIGAPHVYLMLPDDDALVVARGVGAKLGAGRVRQDDSTLSGTAFVTGRPQIITDWTKHPKVATSEVARVTQLGIVDARAAVYIPLETPDGPAGVLAVLMREAMTANDAELLGLLRLLAAEAGIAITRDDLRRRLAGQARTDPLTGLANRRMWDERLELERERCRRSGTPLTVAVLDLDYFKRYNDTRGHPAGDELLRQVAEAWTAMVRPTDTLARLGGEEFGVLLPDADLAAAAIVMERLRTGVPFDQTVSIGLTEHRRGEDVAATMQRADMALYAAKSAGRDQVASR